MTPLRSLAAALLLLLPAASLGAAPLDSEIVLHRYERALNAVPMPKNAIYDYTISQAVPVSIEQRHIVYRSGIDVRDESWPLGSSLPAERSVSVGKRDNSYDIVRTAPRRSAYEILFVGTSDVGGHLTYVYDTIPYVRPASGFTVTRVAIDAVRFLPRAIAFRTSNGRYVGRGELRYTAAGKYWVPLEATVAVTIDGRPGRERIAWGGFRFPPSLPASTFRAAR